MDCTKDSRPIFTPPKEESMRYELRIFKPGIVGFDKKNEPFGYAPEVTLFNANGKTEAMNTAARMYKETGLKFSGHFNVSREDA